MKIINRLYLKYAIDLSLWVACTPFAFALRLEQRVENHLLEIVLLMLVGLPIKGVALWWSGTHRRVWHRVGVRDLTGLIKIVGAVTLILSAVAFFLPSQFFVPRSVPLLEGILAVMLLSLARLMLRIQSESKQKRNYEGDARRVVIVGAGEAGTMTAREMLRHPEAGLRPVGFIDDDPAKRRVRLLGLPVLGGIDELPVVAKVARADEVLIAMPSASGDIVRRVVEHAREADVQYRILPSIYDLLSGKIPISQIREVDVEDLLRRKPVRLDISNIRDLIEGNTVLVTGAGGSIGSEIVRQVMHFAPGRVVLLGRGENSIYHINRECKTTYGHVPSIPVIADVRDLAKLTQVFEQHRPHIVFHAAAHKHVPLMEAHPDQAVLNNVMGTRNLVGLAVEYGVKRFVNISTDKAVNPTSVMGASKRVAEFVVQNASRQAKPTQAFVSVRFGNVLGSRGSVIPLFKKQIEEGGPVTVTHPDMVRYFMTIPEASKLVLQAATLAENGSVYVLDMGEPVKIVDLARDLILLSGLEPGRDIKITFNGVRPGEKLFEELLTAEEGTVASHHEKIFVANQVDLSSHEIRGLVDDLIVAAHEQDEAYIQDLFCRLIPTHSLLKPAGSVVPEGSTEASPAGRSS